MLPSSSSITASLGLRLVRLGGIGCLDLYTLYCRNLTLRGGGVRRRVGDSQAVLILLFVRIVVGERLEDELRKAGCVGCLGLRWPRRCWRKIPALIGVGPGNWPDHASATTR